MKRGETTLSARSSKGTPEPDEACERAATRCGPCVCELRAVRARRQGLWTAVEERVGAALNQRQEQLCQHLMRRRHRERTPGCGIGGSSSEGEALSGSWALDYAASKGDTLRNWVVERSARPLSEGFTVVEGVGRPQTPTPFLRGSTTLQGLKREGLHSSASPRRRHGSPRGFRAVTAVAAALLGRPSALRPARGPHGALSTQGVEPALNRLRRDTACCRRLLV